MRIIDKFTYVALFSIFFFSVLSFCDKSATSLSTLSIRSETCSTNDIIYLNNYLYNKILVMIYSNYTKLIFPFKINGFIVINKKLYYINNSDNVLIPENNVSYFSLVYLNISCDFIKQLMLLNSNNKKKTCDYEKIKAKMNFLKEKLKYYRKKIFELKNNILYSSILDDIVSKYNLLVDMYYKMEDILNNENYCNLDKINNIYKKSLVLIKELDNSFNKSLFSLLLEMVM